ncbi:CHAD domain-containing protein [Pseudomonas sp. MBLB4123]|uniref:CHAD domain-containing protein n=1 Tax=Pseudomonas sp. MBLB4123 TaxID=3451557 RepID=UPI003F74C146
MSLVDAVVAHVLRIEVSLYHARARLEAGTDGEALHDLRIGLRRLRSLLKPLRDRDGVSVLETAAAAVGTLTSAARDLEVLAVELRRRGLHAAAGRREARLAGQYDEILGSPELERLFAGLDAWPADFRRAERDGELRRLDRLLDRRLDKQRRRLQDALASLQHDPHRLRLLVKRNRYAAEAYPHHALISTGAKAALKAVQSALGAWHDRYQWCLRASRESDLRALRQPWQDEAVVALQRAESRMLVLQRTLAGEPRADGLSRTRL